MIAVEQATVYRGGGRRWFTLKAACNAEAGKVFRDRFTPLCDCDDAEFDGDFGVSYPGNVCRYHEEAFRERFVRRVAKRIAKEAA